jgi:L-aminopeptidase/D-esterase-like protein
VVFLPEGYAIGHWTDDVGLTGCTVILCPPNTVGGCDVRGNSPGSREVALLASEKSMQEVHAILLAGGSAFGLAAADGVMRYLEGRGIGYATPWARVPIVPAAVVFDLNIGSAAARPPAEAGYEACVQAKREEARMGSIGAGVGATVGKWAGPEGRMRGGLGMALVVEESLHVAAVVVVNAVGDILDEQGKVLAGARNREGGWAAGEHGMRRIRLSRANPLQMTNTTLVVVATNAHLSKIDANRVAQRGHDGMARAIKPSHTMFDGDIVFALGGGDVEVPVDVVAEAGAEAAARAIRGGVRAASSHPNAPSVSSL